MNPYRRVTLLLAAAAGLLHLAFGGRYDVFRDELYFIVCGRHPQFGYVDQPPLVPLLSAGLYALGHQAWVLRLPLAFGAAALVWLVVALVRKLGGSPYAALLAATATVFVPLILGDDAILSTSAFEPIAWTAVALLFLRAIADGDERALLWAGIVSGIELEAKYSIVSWVVALCVGLLFCRGRKLLLSPWLYAGAVAATLIALPSLVWQAQHGWPFAEIVRNAPAKNAAQSWPAFAGLVAVEMNVFYVPLWLAGLVAPWRGRLRDAAFLSVAFAFTAVTTYLGHGKDYYLAPAFPSLIAVGAVAFEGFARNGILRAGYACVAFALSIVAMPFAFPILDPPALVAYERALGYAPSTGEKETAGTPIPQVFADELPWRRLEAAVAAAYRTLDSKDRETVAIFGANYGDAGAIDVYGEADGLPPAISGHNQYFAWGTRGRTAPILRINGNPERWARICPGSYVVAHVYEPLAVPDEADIPIVRCDHPPPDLLGNWESWKNYE